MKTFTTVEAVLASDLPEDLKAVSARVMADLISACTEDDREYDPIDDGHLVAIEGDESPEELADALLGYDLSDALWEGVLFERGVFVTALLANNQYGVSVAIPDGPWLTGKARANLVANLVPGTPAPTPREEGDRWTSA